MRFAIAHYYELYQEAKMNAAEINKMSTVERLQTMEALWDSLSHGDAEVPSPDWHRDILAERLEKMEKGEAKSFSVEELKSWRSR